MKQLSSRWMSVGFGASVTSLAMLFACAEDATEPLSAGTDAGGAVLPPSDARPTGDAEPATDGDVEVPARLCSDDGFCHSVLPQGQHLRGVWGDGTGVVWAVSLERNILRWDGTSWAIHTRTLGEISCIWGSGPTDVWIATTEGLLRSTGTSSASLAFEPIPDLPGDASIPIRSVWGTGSNDVWAVGGLEPAWETPRGRVLHYAGDPGDGGTGWSVDGQLSVQPFGYRAVWGTPSTGVWVHGVSFDDLGLTHVWVFHRRAGETTWMPILLPPDPNDEWYPFASTILSAHIASNSSVWIVGATALPTKALWRGTSTDDGASFEWSFGPPNPNPNDRDLFGVWGTPDKMWAFGKTGLVSRWTGKKWEQALLSVTGAPVGKSLWAIWGKDDDDFWVVGDEIALHKTSAGKP